MPVESHEFEVATQGDSQVLDLTERVAKSLAGGRVRNGTATIFVVGSTAGITTTEYEPGLATHDLADLFERLAPKDGDYLHEQTWHDDNGHAHVRASLLGPSLTVPLITGRLALRQWQQIVLIDFDTRPRERRIIVQAVGD
jgi:secondary thiamine-phosphate synthase enzyme